MNTNVLQFTAGYIFYFAFFFILGNIFVKLIEKHVSVPSILSIEGITWRACLGIIMTSYLAAALTSTRLLSLGWGITLLITCVIIALGMVIIMNDVKKCFMKMTNIKLEAILTMLILLIVILLEFHMYGVRLSELFTIPGGDARAYGFVANIFTREGITLKLSGKYISYIPSLHFIIFVFPVLNSFFATLLNCEIPIIQLHLYLFFFSMWPFAIYTLAVDITKNKIVGLLAALFSIISLPTLYLYFYWGGVGESLGWFLFIVGSFIIIKIWTNSDNSPYKRKINLLKILVSLSISFPIIFVHSITAFAFLVILIICPLTLRDETRNIKEYALFISLLGLILFIIWSMIQSTESFRGSIPASEEAVEKYTSQFSDPLLIKSENPSIFFRNFYRIITTYFGLSLIFLSIPGIAFAFRTSNRYVQSLLFLTLTLFIFSQNCPTGLYYVSLGGLTTQLPPVRMYYPLGVLLVLLSSLSLKRLIEVLGIGVCKEVLITSSGLKFLIIKFKLRKIKIDNSFLLKMVIKLIALALIATFFLNTLLVDYKLNLGRVTNAYNVNNVTGYDIEAIQWIKGNAEEECVFFSFTTDASTWISVFTDRVTLPPLATRQLTSPVYSSIMYETWNEIQRRRIIDNYTLRLINALAKKLNVTCYYIYIGPRAQYDYPTLMIDKDLNKILIAYSNGKVTILKVTIDSFSR